MEAILIASSKGGVGKSEIAKLTAYQLTRDGHDVALMDADIDSSNLASRMDIEEKVKHNDEDRIVPVEKDGIKVYSMESAFTDSSFSQSGEFMRVVIRNMVQGADWQNPDYLIVDCPPGTKDIFDELVSILRDDLFGAIVVGQSESIDDVGRMVKVCDHNFVPIIGFIENMSGAYMHEEMVTCDHCSSVFAPHGRGNVQALANELEGKYLGSIPLCHDQSEIESAAKNTIKSIPIAIQDGTVPEYPELNAGDKGFVRNVWSAFKNGLKMVNQEFDVKHLQEEFGNPDNPKVIAIELTDADDTWSMIPSKIHLKTEGRMKVVRDPDNVFGGIKISSQELKFALEAKRMVMDSSIALYEEDSLSDRDYGLVDAVQMGKADVWGEDVINYLSLMDKLFEDVIDKTKLQEAVSQAT